MTGRTIVPDRPDMTASLPQVRGRLLANEPLAPLTWFRVGGPAQALFMPEDESDLAYLLANLPREIPVTVIGLGSNLIVRDGGVRGRRDPARPRIRRNESRAGQPRSRRRRRAGPAGREGRAGGGHRGARILSRHSGRDRRRAAHERRRLRRARPRTCWSKRAASIAPAMSRTYTNADMGFTYRHCGVADDVIFTEALFTGVAGRSRRRSRPRWTRSPASARQRSR